MSVVLALASALAFGVSDFLGGLFSRLASAWAVALLAQIVSFITVAAAATLLGGSPTATDVGWGAVSGAGSGLGTYFLYRGLGGGQMNLVAPLSAIGAATLPVLVGIALDERPTTLAWIGIGFALPAIWLVSRGGSAAAAIAGRPESGVRHGLLAGAGFGLLFVTLGQVQPAAGLWPLAVGQCVATLVLAGGAALAKASLRTLPRRLAAGACAVGLCSAGATVLYQLAVRGELVSVTAVLASLYPALTVLLATWLLHERMNRVQAVGLALAAGAVVFVALG